MTVLRRTFLKLAATTLAATSLSPASAQSPAPSKPVINHRRPLIIDTLGSINNPNLPEGAEDGPGKGIDTRALADARAAGLCAFNQTMGYWSGKEEPFELSVRDVAAWDALIRSKPEALIKVLAAKDIRRAQAERKGGFGPCRFAAA